MNSLDLLSTSIPAVPLPQLEDVSDIEVLLDAESPSPILDNLWLRKH